MLFFDSLLQYGVVLTGAVSSFWRGTSREQGEAYLGVYYPTDVSMYDAIYPANPNKNVKQIAELFTELIKLFIEMRYLNEEQVAFPPHQEHPINLTYPARYGFTKDVVDLYQMIPYITSCYGNWNYGTDGGEFVAGGEFLGDLRQVEPGVDMMSTWEQSVIDPTYGIDWRNWMDREEYAEEGRAQMSWGAEKGPYIRPWFAVLSQIGNHGSFMCLNTKNWHMWLVNQLGGSSDPAMRGLPSKPTKPNQNDLENEHSRPAVDLLRDIIERFKSLEWLPGGLYFEEQREYRSFKAMYQEAGWPNAFNPSQFDRLRPEYDEAIDRFRHQTTPLEQLDYLLTAEKRRTEYESRIPTLEQEIRDLESQIAASVSPADESLINELENRKQERKRYSWYLDPITPELWRTWQAENQVRLEDQKAEKQLFLDRQGRFSNMSDEEHEKALKDGWFDTEINRYEKLLADKNLEARKKREEKEIREAVAAVDPAIVERWLEEEVEWGGKDGEWVMDWTQWYEAGQSLD